MKKNKRFLIGFSLIELLVVIAIIGILAGIGAIGYSKYTQYAKRIATEKNAKEIFNRLVIEDTKQSGTCSINGTLDICADAIYNASNMKNAYGYDYGVTGRMPIYDPANPNNYHPCIVDQTDKYHAQRYQNYYYLVPIQTNQSQQDPNQNNPVMQKIPFDPNNPNDPYFNVDLRNDPKVVKENPISSAYAGSINVTMRDHILSVVACIVENGNVIPSPDSPAPIHINNYIDN
jgi:prepilin-type N-terminal cleavage/methylation domain-containing protein